jgi:general stress protein 26
MHAIKYCPNTNYNNEGLIKYITYPTKKDRVMVHFITDRPKITISLGSDSTNFVSNIMYEDTFGLMLLSEQVLKRDWINPQEDEAWKDL